MSGMAPDLIGQFSSSLVKDHVDIIEFAESDKYCGQELYPRQKTLLKILFNQDFTSYDEGVIDEWINNKSGEVEMAPKLEDRLKYLKEKNYDHFRIVQLVGGRRSSKGFLTGLSIAYNVYNLTQIDNVAAHYGVPKSKDIYFSIVADSLAQAKDHQFGDAVNWIVDCKPLQDQKLINRVIAERMSVYTPYDVRRINALQGAGVKVDRDLASIKIGAFGTNSKTIRGMAAIMFVFDEMAHLIAGESRMSDAELYKAAIPSLAQFGKDAMIFANSSPYTKTGQFFKLYENSLMLDPPETGKPMFPDHFMFRFPSWELYKDWELDNKTRKRPRARPQILPPDKDPILAHEELSDPDAFKVEYRSNFAEVVDAFLNPEMVDRMFDPAFAKVSLGRIITPTEGATAFQRYKAHGDPSSTTANFGIAIAHVEEIENPETGILEPHVVFDQINAFFPEDFEDHTIDWLEVVPEVGRLINAYRPYEWTFDQFDSTMAIQVLVKEVKTIGADTNVYEKTATEKVNMRRAQNFKAALNLGRVHAPHPESYNPMARKNPIDLSRSELKFLQIKNGKVDKQSVGPVKTKDIADCIMECVDALIGESLSMSNNPSETGLELGAQGGYFIGKDRTSMGTPLEEWYPRGGGRSETIWMPERGTHRRARGR